MKSGVKVVDKEYNAGDIFSANYDFQKDLDHHASGKNTAKGFIKAYDTGYEMKIQSDKLYKLYKDILQILRCFISKKSPLDLGIDFRDSVS